MVGRLELLIQTQKNLLNSVSHELRSPLARINLSVALLKRRYSADGDDTFERLDRDVARVDLLIGQLLTLSRLEAGLSSAEREDVDLGQLLDEAVADSDFEAQASGRSVTFRTNGSVILGNANPHALSTTVADRRMEAEILVCDSDSAGRGIGAVFAIRTSAADGQRRASRARASG